MGKCIRMLLQGEQTLRGAPPPTPSSHSGEAGDTGAAAQDLRDDVDSLEEGMLQLGTSPKIPFRFLQSSQLPSGDGSLWLPEAISKITLHMRPSGTLLCLCWECTLGPGMARQSAPTFPCMEWRSLICWIYSKKVSKSRLPRILVVLSIHGGGM